MDHNKRKRGAAGSDRKNQQEFETASTTAEYNHDDDAAFMETLISPDFEELSSHFPTFRRAYRAVQQAQAAATSAAAASGNDSAESASIAHPPGSTISHNSSSSSFAACMTQEFSIALTRALLHLQFGVALTHLPLHHLCPPVPNRFFFVQWIQDELLPLLFFDESASEQQQSSSYYVQRRPSRYCGLDIGTGATCIYPLLFAANIQRRRRINHNSNHVGGTVDGHQEDALFVIDGCNNTGVNNNNLWTLYGTDTDPESIQLAKQNVSSNVQCFQSSATIHLLEVDPSDAQQKINNNNTIEPAASLSSTTADASTMLSSWECHPVGPLRRFFQTKMDASHHARQDSDRGDSSIRQHAVQLDFCMTNPPFYDDNDDKSGGGGGERTNPRKGDGRARTCMTVSEGSYPNGEVGFVVDMILDGLVLYAAACQNNTTHNQEQQLQPQLQHNGNNTSRDRHYSSPQQPPGWSCCMCGKKASWIRLHHVVTQLLGPGHVMATEFGPGQLTRWFLAWTFRQPQMQSPLARMEGCSFVVSVAFPASNDGYNKGNTTGAASMSANQGRAKGDCSETACREVMNRLDAYCRDLPGWDLTLTLVSPTRAEIREATPAPKWIDDGLLPECIRNVLARMDPAKRMNLLPPGGHFLLDVQLQTTELHEQPSNADYQKNTVVPVAVHVSAFQHSTHGKKTVGKITSQLEGEICRTNRRWRRKLKRQEDEGEHQDESLEKAQQDGAQPMEIS
jgi:23S rRNA A1618 N6-methylase RlmF